MSMSSRHLKGRFLEDLIESIAEDLLEEERFNETKEWDIAIEREDKVYLIDIKYSLNPISLRHLRSSNEREFQERLGKDVKWVLGTPRKIEGNKEKVRDKFEGDKILQGHEFWNFIANEDRALSKITETLYESNRDGENISNVIDEKSKELAEEWKIRFGEEIINDETVERFF
jgi:competence CoiA-like predicted nuclease